MSFLNQGFDWCGYVVWGWACLRVDHSIVMLKDTDKKQSTLGVNVLFLSNNYVHNYCSITSLVLCRVANRPLSTTKYYYESNSYQLFYQSYHNCSHSATLIYQQGQGEASSSPQRDILKSKCSACQYQDLKSIRSHHYIRPTQTMLKERSSK